ncbi:MAG: Ig domain-containing protein [Patescibacteria group bacterium]
MTKRILTAFFSLSLVFFLAQVSIVQAEDNLSPFFVGWNPVVTATTTQSYSYDVEAFDPEGDSLVFSLLSAPAGMTIDSGTGLISWTPDAAQVSLTAYAVEVQVTDSTSTISSSYQLLVSGENLSPFFVGWNPVITATATQPYSYDVQAFDPEGDPLIFSLVSSTPAGMTINASSGLIEWTPTSSQATSTPYIVTVQLSDPTHTLSEDFEIVVSEATSTGGGNLSPFFVNWNPVITATATQPYSYDVQAFDPEGDPLIFSLVSSTPAGMTINASSGLIEWTPTSSQATSTPYIVTVQLSDPTHTLSEDFEIVVSEATSTTPTSTTTSTPPTTCTVNCGGGGGGGGVILVPSSNPTCPPNCGDGGVIVPPSNLPPYFVNFNPPTVINSGAVYLYDTEAKDPENQPLIFSLLEAPSGMSILPSNGLIYWAPVSGLIREEPYRVLIQVSDGLLSATTSYEIAVRGIITVITITPDVPLTPPVTPATTTPATTTIPVVTATGNPLLALLTNILDWFRDNYCVLGYLLWLLTILAWLAYLLFGEKDDEDQKEFDHEQKELPEDLDDLINELKSEPIMEHDDASVPGGSTTFQTLLNDKEISERKNA